MGHNDRSRSCASALLIMAGVVFLFLVSVTVIPVSFIDVLLIAAICWLLSKIARLTAQQASDRRRISDLEDLLGLTQDADVPELPPDPAVSPGDLPPRTPLPVTPPVTDPELAESPGEPSPARPRPTLDWDLAWRRLAGPFAGTGASAARTEARIGTVWFSRIGVLLLIVGGILAYRHGVIPDQVRVLIGYACGSGLIGLGFWGERRSYRIWAQAMTGGGLGILYLTTIAAAMFFDRPVLPQSAAFVIMALITAVGAGLAVLYDTMVIGILGMIGGFGAAIPLAAGQGNIGLLFGYLAVLDAGLLLVAYFKRWPMYNYLVLFLTWALYLRWRVTTFRPEDAAVAFCFVTVFFAIFAATSITHAIVRRRQARFADAALVLLNGFFYFGLGLDLSPLHIGLVRGLFAFVTAAAHLGLGALVSFRTPGDRLLSLSFLGLAGIFLTLAFPVALAGSWITVAWALEGSVLVLIGFWGRSRAARYGGLVVLALALIRLAVWDTFPGAFAQPLLAPGLRAFTFGAVVLSLYLAAWGYHRFGGRRLTKGILIAAASVFTLWYLTMEIVLHFSQFTSPVPAAMCLVIAGTWGLYGLVLMSVGVLTDSRYTRAGARIVFTAALAWLILSRVAIGPTSIPVRYFGLASVGSAWLGEFLARRRGLDPGINGAVSLAAAVITFFITGTEVMRRLEPALSLAIGERAGVAVWRWRQSTRAFSLVSAWGAHALVTMAAGVVLQSSSARALAGMMSLFTVLSCSVICVNPAAHPVLRGSAFVLIVLGTYLSAFLGGKVTGAQTRIEQLVRPVGPIAAALLTAWWGAAELHHRFGITLSDPSTMVFSILLWLGAYALIVGVAGARLRSPAARWLAFGLQVAVLCGLAVGMVHLNTSGLLRAMVLLFGIGGIYAANRAFSRGRTPAEARASAWLSLAACAFTVVWLGYEITQVCLPAGLPLFARHAAIAVRDTWFVLAAGLYGLAVMAVGLRIRSFEARALGVGIQAVAVTMAAVTALWSGPAPVGLRLAAYAAAAGGVYASVWLRTLGDAAAGERRAGRWLALVTAAVTVLWLTAQVYHYFAPFMADPASDVMLARFARDFGVSAAWGAYGFIVLIVGFVLRYRAARLLGLGILILTLAKVGVHDMWQVGTGWRIWITIGIGTLFVTSSLMYQRFSRSVLADRTKGETG